eukprot:CAMPEP_0198251634 /NCGR_PEP_ID=MMETSP1447-20131203/2404_1 /TAXON_ID=420782 /ORGANISM="Chaetoceros dichaeta, Strain CCMP1751" /LENGTH=167 /DNA_ID=CAMNT_0043936707 /DNA_START=134 /DNA_END=635 /DNA_ORIENTATION=-
MRAISIGFTTSSSSSVPLVVRRTSTSAGVGAGGSFGYRSPSSSSSSSSAIGLIQNRGLEIRTEGATPTPGEMTLYLKAGPDPTLPGDCPFAQTIRMVLTEKNLPYTLRPTTPDTKPDWLLDFYGGALPALRHRKECYVESDVVCQYLEFFFEDRGGDGGLSGYTRAE